MSHKAQMVARCVSEGNEANRLLAVGVGTFELASTHFQHLVVVLYERRVTHTPHSHAARDDLAQRRYEEHRLACSDESLSQVVFATDICESTVASLEQVGEFFVIEAKKR